MYLCKTVFPHSFHHEGTGQEDRNNLQHIFPHKVYWSPSHHMSEDKMSHTAGISSLLDNLQLRNTIHSLILKYIGLIAALSKCVKKKFFFNFQLSFPKNLACAQKLEIWPVVHIYISILKI